MKNYTIEKIGYREYKNEYEGLVKKGEYDAKTKEIEIYVRDSKENELEIAKKESKLHKLLNSNKEQIEEGFTKKTMTVKSESFIEAGEVVRTIFINYAKAHNIEVELDDSNIEELDDSDINTIKYLTINLTNKDAITAHLNKMVDKIEIRHVEIKKAR